MSEQKFLSSSGLQRVWTKIKDLLSDKVDKIAGKGLSTNDYTTTEKNKLAGIAQNAEVNVQSDWTQTDTSSDSYIQHKPDLPSLLADKVDKVDGKGLSTNDYTTSDKNKLAGIAQGAEVNVQSDWEQTDSSKDDFIKNKPDIPAMQIQSDWEQDDDSKKDFIKNKPDIDGMLSGKVDNQYNPIYSGKVLGIDNTGAVVPVTGGGGGSGGSIGLYSITLALNVAGYTETTITDSSVKANMKVVEWFTDTDNAQSDDWSISTADGSYTFVGTIKTAPAVLTVIFGTDGTNVLQEVTHIERIIGNTALPTTAQTLTGAVAELSNGKVNKTDIKNNLTSTDTDKPLSAAMGKSLADTKLPGKMSGIMRDGFKLLTTAKTLDPGIYEYRLGAGSDVSELPSDINSVRVPYSYAIVTVRTHNVMICVMLFNGITNAESNVWINQSNGGTFWGWKKLVADSQEGVYNPTLIDGGTGYTYDSMSCTYTKQGKFVHLVMLFWNLRITDSTSSILKFSLPFQQKSGNERAYGQFGYNGTGIPNAYVGASENQLFFGKHNATTGAEEYITGATMNGKTFQCDLFYVANE